MNKNTLFVTLALCASLNALSQTPSGRAFSRVGSLNELLNRVPINGETVLVETGWNTNDWGGGRLVTHLPSSAATTNLGNVWATTNGVGRWRAQDYRAPIQDARWWTAFGTGTNDTVALQAAINTQPKQLSLFGTPIVTQLLITNKIILEGYGVTMYQVTNGVSTNFIQIASNTPNVIIKGITFDARNQAARGIRTDQNTSGQLLDCTFQNFQEFNTPGKITTVAFYINGGGTNLNWLVDGCVFQDLTGLPDGSIGTGTGFTHGIYVNREFGSASGVDKPNTVLITRSRFLRILPGEDSDAIRWTDSGWTYQDSNISVDNCYFYNIGKRAFKASGSGGRFVNNIITNDFDGSAQATGWIDVSNLKEQYAVVSLYGRNHVVSNNKYNGGRIRHFFDSTVEASNCEIGNNIFTLSTNWGFNGTASSNSSFGTMFGGIYLSSDIKIHDNIADSVQFGVQVFSASTNIEVLNNRFHNPVGLSMYPGVGWGRGIRLGRYSTNYPAGPVYGTKIIGNTFEGFAGDIDMSETLETQIAANQSVGSSINIIVNETDPDGTAYPAARQFSSSSIYGTIQTFRPLQLWSTNTDVVDTTITGLRRRGQVMYDTDDGGLSTFDGRKWSSTIGSTKKSTIGGITTNTWWRVASATTKGYGTRGSARITVGSGGGPTSVSQTFDVNVNYSDAQLLLNRGFSYSTPSLISNLPITAVRVIRDITNEVMHFDFQVSSNLTSIVGVEVQPDWVTTAGLERTNSWEAVAFSNVGTTLAASEVQVAAISNVNQKVFAFNGDQWNWWFGPDQFVFGDGSTPRVAITNTLPTAQHTPLMVYVNGNMNYLQRDAFSGAIYADTYLAPYQTMKFGIGLTNVGTNISVMIAAGANITLTTNGNTITITSTGGGGGSTNGSSVYAEGTYVSTINLIDSSQLNFTYSGTNGSYSIISGSLSTNLIDSTFYTLLTRVSGSGIYIEGVYSTNANFGDSSELNVTLSGTNVTYALVSGSITTNKMDPTFIALVNSKLGTNADTLYLGTLVLTNKLTPDLIDWSLANAVTNASSDFQILANSLSLTNTVGSGAIVRASAMSGATYNFTTGLTNYGVTNVGINIAAGTNIVLTTNGMTIVINNSSTNGGGGTGYLPLTAGSTEPLTGDLHFYRASTTTRIVLGNEGDVTSGYKHMTIQSAGGVFAIVDLSTNTYSTGPLYFRIDPTEPNTNITYFSVNGIGSKTDWVVFDTDRVIIREGTLEIGGTNIFPLILPSPATRGLGDVLVADGAGNDEWAGPNVRRITDAFLNFTTSAQYGAHGWASTANAGTIQTGTPATNMIGVVSISTGSATNSTPTINTGTGQFVFGAGIPVRETIRLKTPTAVSSSTDRYEVRAGYDNGTTNVYPVNGVMFYYREDVNSGNWTAWNSANSVSNLVDTGVAFSASTIYDLEYRITGTNSVVYYINGSAVATNNANIPNGSFTTGLRISILKLGGSTGTTARALLVDDVDTRFKY